MLAPQWGKVRESLRVVRGGAWNNNAVDLRAANRNRNWPADRNVNIGVRCVAAPPSHAP
jgi:formylglycine-generating enzyme required for sulfatase activity